MTDENCTFTCDPGYNLTGSELRTCQSDHTWSGEIAFCAPLKCTELIAPENALITLPCNTEYTSSCNIVCGEGFHIEGDPGKMEWIQTCALTAEEDVDWTEGKKCIGKFSKNVYSS